MWCEKVKEWSGVRVTTVTAVSEREKGRKRAGEKRANRVGWKNE